MSIICRSRFKDKLSRLQLEPILSIISEVGVPVLSRSLIEKLFSVIVPSAYAALGDATLVTFEVTQEAPEPEPVDPLILQYAPVLYFHPDEDYFPMDVNSYINASALWDQSGVDTQLYSSTSLTFEVFEDLVGSGADTSNYYLSFSDPNAKKSIDIDNAYKVYADIRSKDLYATTTYYYKMNASTEDGREFIVLQYWYFYAMNNWKEQGGRNDHEGDWESVFVFLNNSNSTKPYPQYVAYSAHLNDGDPKGDILQYDSVRREWESNEVVKEDGRPVSFVALGSHANYPNNNGGEHVVPGIDKDFIDLTGTTRVVNFTFQGIDSESSSWDQYQGKWGTDVSLSPGGSGPQGPRFIDVTGQTRFSNPLEWAGIDKIQTQVILEPITTVPFDRSNVLLEFTEPIPSGTTISVTPYYEPVTFGVVPNDVTLLPGYYDFTTSLEDGSFEVFMTLPYDEQYIKSLDARPEDIRFGFYNESTDTWEVLPTILNAQDQSVSTVRTSFSRYALMLVKSEDESDHEEDTEVSKEQIQEPKEKHYYGRRLLRKKAPTPKVLGVSLLGSPIDQVASLVNTVQGLMGQYSSMNAQQKEVFRTLLGDIENMLLSLRQ